RYKRQQLILFIVCLDYAFSRHNSFNLPITKSISSRVLFLQNEKRTLGRSGSTPIACNTWEPMSDPELQALPPEADMPAMSKLNNIISAMSVHGNETFNTVYKLFSAAMSPLKWMSRMFSFNWAIMYSFNPCMYCW